MPDKRQERRNAKPRIKHRTGKLKAPKASGGPAATTVSENRLELLITTVTRNKGEYYADLIQSFDVNMQFVMYGRGTADESMLARFGFTDSDKAVIFSVIKTNMLPAALAALDEKFRTIKNGKGIAYTVPMTGVIGKLIYGFLSNNTKMGGNA